MNMTWEQKLDALNSLCVHSLQMRRPGDWYVSATIEIANNGILIGRYGNGKNPEEAVLDHWEKYTTKLTPDQYIVARNYDQEKYVLWNGYMWKDVSYLRKTS